MLLDHFEMERSVLLQSLQDAVLEPPSFGIDALRQHGTERDVEQLAADCFVQKERLVLSATIRRQCVDQFERRGEMVALAVVVKAAATELDDFGKQAGRGSSHDP